MKLKNLIKFLILVVATVLENSVLAQTKHAAIITENKQEIQLESFKYILLNKSKIPRQKWYTIPTTRQKVYVTADLNRYLPNLTVSEINSLIMLPSNYVKPGGYRNRYYDNWGIGHLDDWKYHGIIPKYNYFCLPNGIAVAKTNCGNEQDYMALELIPKEAPSAVDPPKMITMCLGDIPMGDIAYENGNRVGQYSVSRTLYLNDSDLSWLQKTENGWVKICLPDEAPKESPKTTRYSRCLGTTIVMGDVEYDNGKRVGQYELDNRELYFRDRDNSWLQWNELTRNWDLLCSEILAQTVKKQQPQRYDLKYSEPIVKNEVNTANINVDNSVRNFNINIAPVVSLVSRIAQARYSTPYYQPQPQRQYCQQPQRQYYPPQRQWTGSSFDRGQDDVNTSNGTVFDGGQGYVTINNGNGAGFDGSGRIPGVKETVQ